MTTMGIHYIHNSQAATPTNISQQPSGVSKCNQTTLYTTATTKSFKSNQTTLHTTQPSPQNECPEFAAPQAFLMPVT